MSVIENFIQAARDRKAQEILLGPDKPIQFRIGRDLISASSKELSVTDSKNLVAQILNEEEKKSLYQNLKVQGLKNLKGINFKFDFQIDFSGISGSLQMCTELERAWIFPQTVAESLTRRQGLHLLTGPRRSGKSTAVADLIAQTKKAHRSKNLFIACFVENESQILNIENLNLAQFPVDSLLKNKIPHSADLIIIDAPEFNYCEKALELAEKGYNVLLTLPFWNVEMALERFLDLSEGGSEVAARRLGSVLQWAIGCQLLPGIEDSQIGASEILSINSQVQSAIKNQKMNAIADFMNDRTDKLGMRTMNQSLFQLLIKRKIELKTAFEFSPSPEELDLILKKVGV